MKYLVKESFPEILLSLPKADLPFSGVEGWIAQGKDFQIIFFEIEANEVLPPHSHSAQWGIVIEGELSLIIAGKTKKYSKGDSYFIPEGVIHEAKVLTHFRALDFFAEPKRYKIKPEE